MPYYYELGVPVKKIMGNCMSVEGFKVPKIEVLLALKQRAELDRRDSIKGVKDRVDILSLVLKGNVNWKRYAALLRELGMEGYIVNGEKFEFISKFSA